MFEQLPLLKLEIQLVTEVLIDCITSKLRSQGQAEDKREMVVMFDKES